VDKTGIRGGLPGFGNIHPLGREWVGGGKIMVKGKKKRSQTEGVRGFFWGKRSNSTAALLRKEKKKVGVQGFPKKTGCGVIPSIWENQGPKQEKTSLRAY